MSGRRLAALAALCALLLMARAGALSEDAGDYRIEVDIASQITTVYRQEDGSVARQMICSTGLNDATPRGSFQLEASRPADRQAWYFIGQYQCFVKYPTRIRGSILFHSLPYTQKDMGALDPVALEQLGAKASHGCVRLRWPDARWIAMHCPDGTQTRIFTGTARQETLRALLMERSYTGAQGETYEEFIAPIAADGSTALRRGDSGLPKVYNAHPYALVMNSGRPYLVAAVNRHAGLSHYRVDRILDVRLRKAPIRPLAHPLDPALYPLRHPYMHAGPVRRYRLRVDRGHLNDVLDWFGTGVTLENPTRETVEAEVLCDAASMDIWLRRYGVHARVIWEDDCSDFCL